MSPGEDNTRWAQGAEDGECSCGPIPDVCPSLAVLVFVTNFETVAGVVLVALKHPWGSTGGIEEWVGMA